MAQNIALCLVDKNYSRAENHALWALTSLMKEYVAEIALDMKDTAEAQGRSEPSLIDALHCCHDRDVSQADLQAHFESKELSLAQQHQHLNSYKQTVQQRIDMRMENINRTAQL